MNLLGIIFLVALSSTVFAGYGSINNIWKKKKINVCFSTNFNPHNLCNIVVPGINNPIEELEKLSATFSLPSESEKAQIASWVNSEFTIKRTGIEFQNWGDCKRLNNRDYGKTDAVIFFTKIANSAQSSGRAHLGACIEESSPGAVPYVYLSLSMTDTKVLAYENSRFLVESTALDKAMTLHEFMHLAGLHHDDMRGVWGDAFYGPLRMQRLTEIDMFSITSYRWIHVGIAQNGGYLRFYDSTADLYSRGDKNVGLIMDQKEKSAQSILDKLKQDPPTDRIVESDPSMYRLMQTKVGLSEGDIFSLRCLHKIKQKDIFKKCDNATPWL